MVSFAVIHHGKTDQSVSTNQTYNIRLTNNTFTCRNVSHCHRQQSFSGLPSPGRSHYTINYYYYYKQWMLSLTCKVSRIVQKFITFHYRSDNNKVYYLLSQSVIICQCYQTLQYFLQEFMPITQIIRMTDNLSKQVYHIA